MFYSYSHPFQYVYGDRIIDQFKEVMWRGAGSSYLMHSENNYLATWSKHITNAKLMGLNTMRLAFKFTWDNLFDATADNLNLTKMDEIVDLLAQNGIKSILDYHGSQAQMFVGNTTNPQLISSWVEVAEHYKNNHNVVAYELYNEPSCMWGATYRHTSLQNAQAYHNLTLAVRNVDVNHIVIWETPSYYIASFEEITDLMLPNVVYTAHEWWTNKIEELNTYDSENLSKSTVEEYVVWRNKFGIPIWLGEFGGPGGGSSPLMFNRTDLHWAICEQLLYRCEELGFGWNLWMGATSETRNYLDRFMPLFPLSIYNSYWVLANRQPFISNVPYLTDFITSSKGIDVQRLTSLELWHNNDYVTFRAGITIRVMEKHKLVDNSFETVTDTIYTITNSTTITNKEGTVEHSGDWNTEIYSLR